MAKHAVYSPSSAKRWMTCPGSVALTKGIVEPPSKFADEGTAAHFLGATCLQDNKDSKHYLGQTVELCRDNETGEHFEQFLSEPRSGGFKVLNRFAVDEDMAEHVQVYIDYVRDLVTSTGGELFVEVSVPLTHLTDEEGACGTSDTVIVAEGEVIVVDLKYGMGVEVSAEENEQLMMYASGVLEKFKEAGDFTHVRMAISQPRVSKSPSEWACTVEELRAFEAKVFEAATSGSNALVPSDEACLWCKAKAICPQLQAKVQEEIGADFDNLLTGPNVGVPENLSKAMACLDLIEGWCKAVRGEVEKQLLSGNEVEGYKLVQGRKGARAWSSAEAAEAMLRGMRLKVAEMYDLKLISPTTAEKVLSEQPKKWAKVQELITQSEGKPSVAPVTDKRPAITVTPVADDFDAV